MGRGERYFVGILTSRMSIYAYLIGSSITTGLLYIGLLNDAVYLRERLLEGLPIILDMYVQIAIPLWVPPITSTDVAVFVTNCLFGLFVLLYWTANYTSSTQGL
jgi:hypothetical protein